MCMLLESLKEANKLDHFLHKTFCVVTCRRLAIIIVKQNCGPGLSILMSPANIKGVEW